MRENGAEYIVRNCIEVDKKNILLLYDGISENIVEIFYSALLKYGKAVKLIKIDTMNCHGTEPSGDVAEKMLCNDAIICLTQHSIAHTNARKKAEQQGIPFLSLPEYTMELLNNPAIFADYQLSVPLVKEYSELLTVGKEIWIETQKGTCLYMNIENRVGNCCPGVINDNFLLGSPPDIEANIAPVENRTNGCLVIDGSIADSRFGLLHEPVRMQIREGHVFDISSANKEQEKKIKEIFANVKSDRAYIVGEFGIGFNDCAKLCGNMLVDEGSKGCVHFGMGSNWTIGGKNKVSFHLDFILKESTVKVDNHIVIDRGRLIYER